MKKPKREEEKADNLEIESIGALYKGGPWDKKYWSSSRGKDRYPYPIGYQAIRTHNGSTYKMEIREGLKGPLFVITSANGQSCSGQTADIAWEKFQKQGFPRVKLLHGKRFSCKIDGVEFFGFRNSFVQRLLRELVANVNGTAERSLLASSFCNGANETEHERQCSDPCTYPDLVQYLARASVTGKRSRKHKFINMKSIRGVNVKKIRSEDLTCNGELPVSGNLGAVAVGENSSFSSDNAFPNKMSEETPERSLNFLQLDRSQGCQMHELSFSMATENNNEEVKLPTDAPGINYGDLCAPDTLDSLHDNIYDSAPTSPKGNSCFAEPELISCHMVNSEGSVPESHPEENASSEKNDFDSVGQEMAKSMMTVLLPQALPLLKKATKKKKTKLKPSEISSFMVKIQEDTRRSENFMDVMSPARMRVEEREGKMHVLSSDQSSAVPSSEHVNSVIQDSFENDQCGQHVINQLHFDLVGADQATDKYTCATHVMGLLGSDDSREAPSVCHVKTSSNKEIYCPPHMPLDNRCQKGDIHISESALSCTSPRMEASSEKSKDVSSNLWKNSACLETHSEENAGSTVPSCIEDTDNTSLMVMDTSFSFSQKEINSKGEDSKSGNIFPTQIPDVAPLTRQYDGPLSESVTCRDLEDDCAPEAYPATKTLLASEICQVSNNSSNSNDKVSVGLEASPKRKLHSSHIEKSTLNPEGVCYSMDPVKSQSKPLASASDCTKVPDPPVSIEKCHSTIDKELARHSNHEQFTNSDQWFQEQGKSFCSNNIVHAEEVQANLDLKPHMVEGINNKLGCSIELVGCYVHPMPISSVLLCIVENEINICVSGGPLLDKDRTLFMYKLSINEPRTGCPSFIGHASIMLPCSRGTFGRQISLDRSGLQFTPDGQCLVLLNSIKAPYCREGKVHCPCSACTSDCFEENAVKIVQVKLGYVSLVTKMTTVNSVLSILVCRPNRLVAVEEGGRLHLWVMNSAWSAQTEEFVIPTYDCISPGVLELKQIPNSAHLVIGHNALGEFGLWDISKGILVSRFSAPNNSVFHFLPISLFNWEKKGSLSSNTSVEEHVNKSMAATKMSLSEHSENNGLLPLKEHHMGIWLVVSTVPDSEAQCNYENNCQLNPVGWWRLALLVEHVVHLGSVLDPRASTIGASAGHGIIATCDGLLYMWELSTGTKLGTLHYFKDGGVSCIATDDSRSGVVAVANVGGELRVYLHHQRDFEK